MPQEEAPDQLRPVQPPPEAERQPGQNVFDPEYIGWLQEQGYMDVSRRVPAPAGVSSSGPFRSPVPRFELQDISVNVKQAMKDDFMHFIKGKGYSVLDEPLPSKEEAAARLAQSTAELHENLSKRFGTTLGPIEKEKIYATPSATAEGLQAARQAETGLVPRMETIGPRRPGERVLTTEETAARQLEEQSFWKQMNDVNAVYQNTPSIKTGFLPADAAAAFFANKGLGQFFVDTAARGVTAGIISPQVLDKLDNYFIKLGKKIGLSPDSYKTMQDRREMLLKEMGYYPGKVATAGTIAAQLIPVAAIAKRARLLAVPLSTVPIVQRLLTGLIGGAATGGAQVVGEKLAGEKLDVKKDLAKIPTHMLWWSLFEMGSLGMETAAKIVNWNLKYGPQNEKWWKRTYGTGKYGGYGAAQGINVETQYAEGRGPTTKSDFTARELRDIFQRGDPSYSGPGKIPVEPGPGNWERHVYDQIKEQAGWHEALRRGWASPTPVEIPGEPPVITGFRTTRVPGDAGITTPMVNDEFIPMKPDMGQMFRKGGAPRPWPAPENAPAAPGATTSPPPTPGAAPAPEVGPQAQPGPSAGQAGPPPAGSAPPAVSGAPGARQQAPPPPRETPPPRTGAIPEVQDRLAWKREGLPIEQKTRMARERKAYLEGLLSGTGKGAWRDNGQRDLEEIDSFLSQAEKPPITTPPPKAAGPTVEPVSFTWRDEGMAIPDRVDKAKARWNELVAEGATKPEPARVGEIFQEMNDLRTFLAQNGIPRTFLDTVIPREFTDVRVKRANEIAAKHPGRKIKVTPNEDGSFTVENAEEPAPTTEIPPEAPAAAPTQLPRDQPLRDAIDRIRDGEGTMEDVDLLGGTPRKSERFNKIIEELRPQIEKIRTKFVADEAAKKPGKRGPVQIQQELSKLRDTIETLREEGDPDGIIPNLEAQRAALTKEWEATKTPEAAARPERRPRPTPTKEPGLRFRSSPAFPSQRFLQKFETPHERARRVMMATAAGSRKRGLPGWPKGQNKLYDDIFEITGGTGIRPMTVGDTGKVSKEFLENVPRFMRNKNSSYAFDDVTRHLADKGWNLEKDDIFSLLKQADKDTFFGEGPTGEEQPPVPTEEEVKERIDDMRKEFSPIMNEGETIDDFLKRMAKEAAEDGFGTGPDAVDEYILAQLAGKRRTPGGGGTTGAPPGEAPPTPFFVSVEEAKKQDLWWPNRTFKSGQDIAALDPFAPAWAPDAGPDVYSDNVLPGLSWHPESVVNLPGWEMAMKRMTGSIKDPDLDAYVQTLRDIYEETNHYGLGRAGAVPFTPPFMWKAQVRDGYTGTKSIRTFQLKYLLGMDATARMLGPMIGNPNFTMTNPLYVGTIVVSGRPGGTIGAMYNPRSGMMALNQFWIDEAALQDPWGMAAYMRDIVLHEFTHFWEPVHNERFTSRLMLNNGRMASAWPYLLRIAEKMVGRPAVIDKRKSFIALGPGPGQGQKVSNLVIRTAGEETAKIIAEGKESKGDISLYVARKPEGEAPGGGGAGQPGETGGPRAGGGAQLPYPREAQAGGRPRLRFGQEPPGFRPRVEPPPEGEFALTPPEEKPAPFKPEDLGARQGVLPMDDAAPLFTDKAKPKAWVAAMGEKRPLPKQPKILEEGEFPAVRTDDGGIYFDPQNRYPYHYELVEGLRIPPERVVGGGFIKDGDYIESPISDAIRLGRDAREAMGLPREVYASIQFKPDELKDEIQRLTSGKNFPREWQGNTDQEVLDNRQNLARFVLENYKPEMGPLENYINANKGFFIRGEAGRKGMAKLKAEEQFPKLPSGEESGIPTDRSAFAPESAPKNKPPAEPEMPGKTSKQDIFGAEEIRVVNALRSAAQAHNKELGGAPEMEDNLVDILKSRLLADEPESFESIGRRVGKSREFVREHFHTMLESLRDNPAVLEAQQRHLKYLFSGAGPTPEDLRRLAKWIRKYFSSYRGADKAIDQMNDRRIGERLAEIFEQTLDAGVIQKWLKDETPAVNEYALGLMKGAQTGDAYTDIFNSAIPFKVKEAMLTTRARIDRLTETIITYGAPAEETKASMEGNMGKYLTRSYRLYEDKRWSPTPAQQAGFKRYLMNRYNMTDEQADKFIEAELAYGRNDEGARPRRGRRSRRIPTDNYIRRKDISPELREFSGEIDRLPWLLVNTVTKQATMAFNAKFLDAVADYLPDHWTDNYEEAARRGWQHSHFDDHNYAYGKLQGKWVDPELFQYIKHEVDVERAVWEELLQAVVTNPFKWTRTIGSYPAHARNFLGNIPLSLLTRNFILNPLNVKWYLRAADIHANVSGKDRSTWAELIRQGVTETQFYGQEIPKIHKDIMRFDPAEWYEKLYDMAKWPIDKAGELFNFGDSLYRVASHLKNTAPESEGGFGMTAAESVDELNMGLQNYRKLPIAADVLRRVPVLGVFVSFRWNIAKIIANQARRGWEETRQPETRGKGIGRLLRLAAALSFPFIVAAVAKELYDVDDEATKELEQWYPAYRRNGQFVYFRGEDGQLKVNDISYLWPTGDINHAIKAIFSGDEEGLKESLDFFSHPIFDLVQIAVKGEDPTYGTKYRSFVDKAKAALGFLYLPASMPIPNLEGLIKEGDLRPGTLTGSQIKKIIDAFNQQPDKYGRVPKLPEEVKNFFSGVRTWDVEPAKLLAQAAVIRNAEIRELQSELTNWIIRNSKAPAWEKDERKARFTKDVDRIAAELRDIGALYKELQAGGFKVRSE